MHTVHMVTLMSTNIMKSTIRIFFSESNGLEDTISLTTENLGVPSKFNEILSEYLAT